MARKKPPAGEAPLSSLVPWDKNPRKNDIAAQKLAETIRELGWGAPIVAQKSTGRIIAGHTRYKAAHILGLTNVPVRFVDVDDRTADRLALADNKLGEVADWDAPELASILEGFSLEEADVMGWDSKALEDLANEVVDFGPLEEAEENEVPEPPADPVTKPGDVWVLGSHRLLCGSCEDLPKRFGDKFDLMVTDPPYGVSYADKNEFLNQFDKGNKVQTAIENDHRTPEEMRELWTNWFKSVRPMANKGAAFYVTGPQMLELFPLLVNALNDADFPTRHLLIWAKNNHVLGRCDYHYKHEPIIYGWVKGSHYQVKDRSEVSVWEIDRPQKSELHPTMKPVELYARAIRNSSDEGALVLEPFGGSGTAFVACEQLSRRCLGSELSPAYCDVIVQRWEELTGGKAKRESAKAA